MLICSIRSGRLCPPVQSERSIYICWFWRSFNVRIFPLNKVSNNIKINREAAGWYPQSCGQLIFNTSVRRLQSFWNINDPPSRKNTHGVGATRRQTKVSHTSRSRKSGSDGNTLILNLPLTPQLWSNVKQQTVNFVRGRWIRKANSRHARGYVVVLCVHNINLESNWPVLWQLQLLWLCAHLEDCWASSWRDVLASAPGGGGGVRGVKRHGKLSQVTNRIENRWTNAHKNPKSTLKKVYLVR